MVQAEAVGLGVEEAGKAFLLFVSATFCRTGAETLEGAGAAFLSL